MKRKIKGEKGEELACGFLASNSYKILERNWRFQHYEIDVIAKKKNELIIVEVKWRRKVDDIQLILKEKQKRRLVIAANHYIRLKNWQGSTRFDLIVIEEDHSIQHFKRAFFPALNII